LRLEGSRFAVDEESAGRRVGEGGEPAVFFGPVGVGGEAGHLDNFGAHRDEVAAQLELVDAVEELAPARLSA